MTITRLAPSSAHRWTRCAASPTFEALYPEETPSDEAREGTAAAWVAECVLKGDAHEAFDIVGKTHKNGWLVTPDMAFHVQGYIDMIKARGGVTTAETRVYLTELINGTLDSSTSGNGPVLYVDDLKFGMSLVDVFQNMQLLIYGAGEYLRICAQRPDITHVQFGIYQPRAFHPDGIYRTWKITVAELAQWANWIIERGNDCLAPQPVATPGPHCKYCNALTRCAALAATNYSAYEVVRDTRHRDMTSQEAANEWLFLDSAITLLRTRMKAVEAEISERYKKEYFPGVQMVETYGHRKFNFPPDVVTLFTGVSAQDTVSVTPAELERRGAHPGAVKALSSAPYIGHKLKRIPANHIDRIFKNG